ncbi:hypothetical protein CPB83DRAFT_818878 [Crepidotus variabilis]|uniref:Copper-fist domain-containing protein n=1 Tax=Crepidotus variabilis TaxID=179855 RepID=A0A9P6EA53_9AGAR|nr:hypothetical protein CPB83DRAFT_818878 [Crepidotus variabilis]
MIISAKKYACETCIKGHRSSSCRHTDRPLFEIKKKGRPVTQCEHCRELRKTKQVHVKCVCESRSTHPEPASQGSKSGFERATFPNGLPQALEASVAFQTSAEGSSSDSDHGGVVSHGPQCKSGMPCTCITPKARSRKKVDSHDPRLSQSGPSGSSFPDAMSNSSIMKRIAELRPVLPRPTNETTISGPVHIPSTGQAHPHLHRHHKSGQAPYELAYGISHHQPLHRPSHASTRSVSNPSSYNDQSFHEQMRPMASSTDNLPAQWNEQSSDNDFGLNDFNFPSICGCGDDCACPGCLHHNRSTSVPTASAYASCTNPGACSTCLDCTIMSLPASALLPVDDTALSIPNTFQQGPNVPVAEWLRQVSATDFASNSFSNLSLSNDLQQWGDSSFMNSNFDYALANMNTPIPSTSEGSYPLQSSSTSSVQNQRPDQTRIDPRLFSSSISVKGSSRPYFIGTPPSDSTRSRSPSESSQSSHQGSESQGSQFSLSYTLTGRQQGLFAGSQQSGRTTSQHHVQSNRPALSRGISSRSSASLSPSPSSTTGPPFGP